MKLRIAGTLLSLSLATTAFFPMTARIFAQADTSSSKPEPEYEGHYYAFGADGKIMNLENVQPRPENKTSNMVFKVKSSSAAAVPNSASSVRLPATVHFAVKGDTHGMDPTSLIKLVKLSVSKNERLLVQSSSSATVLGAHGNASDTAYIPITVKKYGAMSLEIIPTNPLPPGEYALFGNGRQNVEMDCFGVD